MLMVKIRGQTEDTRNSTDGITSVTENCTQYWRLKKEFMPKSNVSHRSFREQKAKYPETEGMLYTYICDKCEFYIMWYSAVAQINKNMLKSPFFRDVILCHWLTVHCFKTAKWSCNITHQKPSDAASHTGRTKTSSVPLQKLKMS